MVECEHAIVQQARLIGLHTKVPYPEIRWCAAVRGSVGQALQNPNPHLGHYRPIPILVTASVDRANILEDE